MADRQRRVAVVTGGASGMGEATCHELGRRGLKVAVLDVNGEAAGRVAEELRSAGVTALGVEVDVVDRSAVQGAFAKVRAELGPVAVLVTSAGKAAFSTRIRLADSQNVVAIAELSDGSLWSDTVEVIVTLAACLEYN